MAHSFPDIYMRKGGFEKDDWDDTALIKAYDRAMGTIKEKLQGKVGPQIFVLEDNKNKKANKKWKVGDYCQAVYSEDSLLYEARILAVKEDEGKCVVRFIGYENEEEVDLDSIGQSQGKFVRTKQIEAARKSTGDQWEVWKVFQWEVGDLCLAVYSQDRLYYQAVIKEIYTEDETCLVKYIGYGNEEEVSVDDMLPLTDGCSLDRDCIAPAPARSREKNHSSMDESSSTFSSDRSPASHNTSHGRPHSHNSHRLRRSAPHRHSAAPDFFVPSSAVPVPINIETHDELGPMLMAWYMAGFHTGYYQGRSSRLMPGGVPSQSTPNLRHPH